MKPSLVLFLLAAGCQDYELNEANDEDGVDDAPAIRLEPQVVEFGAFGGGLGGEQTFTVMNEGDATLTVSSVTVSGSGYTLAEPFPGLEIGPGEEHDVTVSFVALGPGELVGTALVASNDPKTPLADVDLTGVGLMPALVFEPTPYSFGGLWPGCEKDTTITVRNEGEADLDLESLMLVGEGFSATSTPTLPLTLGVGEETTMDVRFSPLVDGEYAAMIWATSNDPRGAVATALDGVGGDTWQAEEEWIQPEAPTEPVDILIWVDTSESMDDDAENLANNTASFTNELLALDADYQVMVVTRWTGCHNETFITPETGDPAAVMRAALSQEGAVSEQGLRASTEAISVENTDPGACNEGFLREDASLSVVLVSDEPEQSPDPWSDYVATIEGRVPGAIISAVAGDLPDGCATAEAGTGYSEAATATGGVFLSICDTDWGTHLVTLAEASVGLPRSFPLTDEPVEGSIEVEVDGVALTSGWAWLSGSNILRFDADAVPGFGSTITVRYDVAVPPCDE